MKELMNKMDNLINEIDSSDVVLEIKNIKKRVYNDKELIKLLKEYENNPNDRLKEKILNNSLFQEYKNKEIDLNVFIMELNKRMKDISKKGSCNIEDN